MKRLNINSDKHGIRWMDLETQEQCQAVIDTSDNKKETYTGHWGTLAYTKITPAVIDPETQEVLEEEILEDIPATVIFDIQDITTEVEDAQRRESLKLLGAKARKACEDAYDLISGHNLNAQLTIEQINQMAQTFAPIITALQLKRPTVAKGLISAIEVDGVILTEQLKSDVLNELKDF